MQRPTNSNDFARQYVVDISLTAAQLNAYYAGSVQQVSARDRRGVRLQFPLNSLRPYVGHNGVRGTFCLRVDGQNRLLSLDKLA